jgi:hypothetical protein
VEEDQCACVCGCVRACRHPRTTTRRRTHTAPAACAAAAKRCAPIVPFLRPVQRIASLANQDPYPILGGVLADEIQCFYPKGHFPFLDKQGLPVRAADRWGGGEGGGGGVGQ